MSRFSKIIFVHGGREAYPEIAAYRAFFASRYETAEERPHSSALAFDLSQTIVWMIMGFYPKKPPAGFVIHDYRSLSIGRLWRIKDWVKRMANAKPDVRIFQNEAMAKAMGFGDGVPTFFLPMGVPPFVASCRAKAKESYDCDFCYIGVMSAERRTQEMIDSFLKRFGSAKIFHLYGEPEPFLGELYKENTNIVFKGRQSQQAVFAALTRARAAVNYFPNHHPHRLQTPTKLLEYAALGLRIACNEQPQSRLTSQQYGIHCWWGVAQDMFALMPDELTWPDNQLFDPAPLLWPSVIERSGIAALLETEGEK
ncbi:MAG: hypothetical protein WC612_00920 [Bdellovibrionales bacterium]|jgi:hypothetical protein